MVARFIITLERVVWRYLELTPSRLQFDARDEVTAYQRDGVLNSDGTVTKAVAASTLGFDGAGNRTQVAGSWAPNSYTVNALNQYTATLGAQLSMTSRATSRGMPAGSSFTMR